MVLDLEANRVLVRQTREPSTSNDDKGIESKVAHVLNAGFLGLYHASCLLG